ncbi:MAG TPA: hypothetical protein VLM79_39480 [Kofleriaceae bacterium]|nr:hypothetical protein [Kofleriaceae bacterium]
MCICDEVPLLAAMAIEVPFLLIGAMRWRNPVPRPGVVLAALLAATATTVVASTITMAVGSDAQMVIRAARTLALAGAALAVLVHVTARRPGLHASELLATARAMTRCRPSKIRSCSRR